MEKQMVRLALRSVAVALLLVVPLQAQDLSTTPMQVQRMTFNLTVTTRPFPSRFIKAGQGPHGWGGTNAFAIQDPERLELFMRCWNTSKEFRYRTPPGDADLNWHVECGKVWGTLGIVGAETDDQRVIPPEVHKGDDVYVFQEVTHGLRFNLLSVLRTTVVVVSNNYCVGAFLIPSDKAHGNLLLHVDSACLQRSQSEVDADKLMAEKEKAADVAAIAEDEKRTKQRRKDAVEVEAQRKLAAITAIAEDEKRTKQRKEEAKAQRDQAEKDLDELVRKIKAGARQSNEEAKAEQDRAKKALDEQIRKNRAGASPFR